MNTKLQESCWTCGDSVTVYQIISESHWTMKKLDGEEMGNWVFEALEPGIQGVRGGFKALGYEIVVAGENFGCGSKSVEHPMAALKGAGVKLVVAESVSRYSYRNAINLALPVVVCPGITKMARRDDVLNVDIESGLVVNKTTGERLQGCGLNGFAMSILNAGGLLNYIEQEI